MRLVSVLVWVSRDRVRRVVTSRQGASEREGRGVLDTCFSVDDDDVNLRVFTPAIAILQSRQLFSVSPISVIHSIRLTALFRDYPGEPVPER